MDKYLWITNPWWLLSRFGKVFEGEIMDCQRIARQTRILLDPIYTLAG
jgi:1-aminocyclopropane-1-carboxylate deaminase/D-cysteine desulfhydrase-like pyridoxal-dependent ACC family enzyme